MGSEVYGFGTVSVLFFESATVLSIVKYQHGFELPFVIPGLTGDLFLYDALDTNDCAILSSKY